MSVVTRDLLNVIGEISEAFEEVRNGHGLTETYYNSRTVDIRPDGSIVTEGNGKPEGYPIELADAVIRLFDHAYAVGIDLDEAIAVKMQYNETRSYRHGGKKA